MSKKSEEMERKELLWRILIGVVTGVILHVWKILVALLAVVNFVIVLFTGKRDKGLVNFSEYFNTVVYEYLSYMTFRTNKHPFPFNEIKRMGKFEK